MSETDITVCVRCQHHRNTHPGGPAGPSPTTWFYQRCAHPDVEHPKTIDPVTGEVAYAKRNDLLSRPILVKEPHPYCCDINDGYCGMYRPKSEEDGS